MQKLGMRQFRRWGKGVMVVLGLIGLASVIEDASRWWGFLGRIVNFIRSNDWLGVVLLVAGVVGWLAIRHWTGRKLQELERRETEARALEANQARQRQAKALTELVESGGHVLDEYNEIDPGEIAPSEGWHRFKRAVDVFERAVERVADSSFENLHREIRDRYLMRQTKGYLEEVIGVLGHFLRDAERSLSRQ